LRGLKNTDTRASTPIGAIAPIGVKANEQSDLRDRKVGHLSDRHTPTRQRGDEVSAFAEKYFPEASSSEFGFRSPTDSGKFRGREQISQWLKENTVLSR
jgi:hypothetical protein